MSEYHILNLFLYREMDIYSVINNHVREDNKKWNSYLYGKSALQSYTKQVVVLFVIIESNKKKTWAVIGIYFLSLHKDKSSDHTMLFNFFLLR